MQKIYEIISECDFGIHDISCTDLDIDTRLPRFNMPFELGLFFGCKHFSGIPPTQKTCLILDSGKFRYRKFLSDISGYDIVAHANDPTRAIACVRNWLSPLNEPPLPGAEEIQSRYLSFSEALPTLCEQHKLVQATLTYSDFVYLVKIWLQVFSRLR